MKQIDDTTLMAYLDGEIDDAHAAEIDRAIGKDIGLRDSIATMRSIDAQIKAALAPALHGPMPRLRVTPLAAAAPSRAKRFAASWMTAAAASLALLALGTALGIGVAEYADYRTNKLLAARAATEQTQAQLAFAQALEKSISGQTVSWRNPDSGASGGVTPVRTFKNAENQFCREFRQWQTGGVARENKVGIACRENGAWRVRAIVVEE